MQAFRIGYGFDVHRLCTGRKLILGGIEIPSEKGCLGHSDADVLVHAICDALLGSLALGDIGKHFPDTENTYKNINSCLLLEKVFFLLKERGYRVANIDSTICLESPKIGFKTGDMSEKLAQILEIEQEDVSVKASTTEKLGFEGRGEGVSAHAVCLVYKI